MDATGFGVGFLMALVVIVSLALHWTCPHRCTTYFQIFHGEGFELPAAMGGKRCTCGGIVSNAWGAEDSVCQGSALSNLHKAETLGQG